MKKRCVPAIIALVLAFGGSGVYGAESEGAAAVAEYEENDNVLTVDEAVSKGIAYSRTLKTLYESNEVNELTAKDTRTSLVNSSEYIALTNLNAELKNLMNSMRNYDSNVEIEKERIRLNVIELFASIISAEDSIELYEKQIELNERDLKISRVKNSLGLLSQTDYDALEVENNKVKTSKQSLEIAVEEAYTSLNKILGMDLNTSYKVVLDIDYEPLGEADLEYAVARAVNSSQTIKEKQEAATLAKYKLDVYSSEYSGGYKENAQNSYNQATRSLADAKTEMEANLRSVYNSIQTAEINYSNNLAALEQKEKELEVKAVQLQLGKITQLEYDKAEYEIEQMKNTLKNSVYSHYALVCRFNNPDLI